MIDVELGTGSIGDPEATYQLGIAGLRAAIVVHGYEDDTFEDVARGMCRALALLGFRGEVRLFYDGMADEEGKEEIFATIERLKGTLEITDEDAARAAQGEQESAERVMRGFRKVHGFMREEALRRGLTKEERERLTLGEALRPQEDQ